MRLCFTASACMVVQAGSTVFLNASVNAQNTAPFLEELAVTATHISGGTAPGLTRYSLEESDIASLSGGNIALAFQAVPGVDIHQQGGTGGLTFLSLRGGDPNFTTILIDGVKVNDPTNSRGGAFDLASLDPSLIEEIDVYYGSLSGVFGSDALSGVVSIKTKGLRAESGGQVTASMDTDETMRGSVYYTQPLSGDIAFAVSGTIQDGDEGSFRDVFNRHSVSLKVGSVETVDTKRAFGWRAGVLVSDGTSAYFPEDSGGDRLAIIRTPESRSFNQKTVHASAYWHFSPVWQLDMDAAWARREEMLDNPGIADGVLSGVPATYTETGFETWTLDVGSTARVTETLTLAFGGSLYREEGNSDGVVDFGFPLPTSYMLERTTQSLYAEAIVQPMAKFRIMSGVRYDEAAGLSATTARFSAAYEVSHTGEVMAYYGEGFKMPSFFALAHPLIGNPDLLPERSRTYDLGFSQRLMKDRVFVRMSVYKNRYNNLVDFDPVLFTNLNRATVTAKGVELMVKVDSDQAFTVEATLGYNDMSVAGEETKLRRRPKWKGGVSAGYDVSQNISVRGRLSFRGSYYDSAIPTGMIVLGGSTSVDMSLEWRLQHDFMLRASVYNTLDSSAEEAIGFLRPERRASIALSKNF